MGGVADTFITGLCKNINNNSILVTTEGPTKIAARTKERSSETYDMHEIENN